MIVQEQLCVREMKPVSDRLFLFFGWDVLKSGLDLANRICVSEMVW